MTTIKNFSFKDFIPKDPSIIALLKRMGLVVLMFGGLGMIIVLFLTRESPSVVISVSSLLSIVFGLVHLFTTEEEEENTNIYEPLILASVLSVIGVIIMAIPLAYQNGSVSIALLGSFFILPTFVYTLLLTWDKKPVFVVPTCSISSSWIEAFIEGLLMPSRHYLVFSVQVGDQYRHKIGYSVDAKALFSKKEASLKRLLSNWLARENQKVTNIIPTYYTTANQEELIIQWSFSNRLPIFKKFYDPLVSFKNHHFWWRPKIKLINGAPRLIWAIKITVRAENIPTL